MAGKVESVRLVGIESPEARRTEKAKRQAEEHGLTLDEVVAKGEVATERMREMVEGRKVTLVWPYEPGKRDRFKRLLAYVEVDGVDVGEVLLREGVVWLLAKYEHPREERYRQASQDSPDGSVPSPATQKGDRIMDFAVCASLLAIVVSLVSLSYSTLSRKQRVRANWLTLQACLGLANERARQYAAIGSNGPWASPPDPLYRFPAEEHRAAVSSLINEGAIPEGSVRSTHEFSQVLSDMNRGLDFCAQHRTDGNCTLLQQQGNRNAAYVKKLLTAKQQDSKPGLVEHGTEPEQDKKPEQCYDKAFKIVQGAVAETQSWKWRWLRPGVQLRKTKDSG